MAKKENNSKLIKEYTGGQFKTELWWNDETKQFDVWRNKKVVKNFCYKGMVLHKDEIRKAIIECDEWFDDTEKANLTLNEYLQRNNIQLTKLEVEALECILSQGSFYEESECMAPDRRRYGQFFGWEIKESEVEGCRGALSSLKRKGIINVMYDDTINDEMCAGYYTYFGFEFEEDSGHYHSLKIDASNIK